MLRGHGWVDKTRPHNLFADWSQEEKSNTLTEKLTWMKIKKETANMGTEILTYKLMYNYVTFLYSGQLFQTSRWVHKQ